MNRAFRALGRRNVLIAVLGVVVIGAGSGVGIYLQSRAHHSLPQSATRNLNAAPTAVPVGVTTVAEPKQAVTLTVVSTKPGNGSAAIPLESGITLAFNLAVNPATVKSFLSIQATNSPAPTVAGAVAQGKAPTEVVFKPSAKFDFGTSVNVTVRGGLTSLDGAGLSNDYSFTFTTIADPRSVLFMAGYGEARLVNGQSGRPLTLTIQKGDAVPPGIAIKTYQASAKDLLAGLVYSTNGYANNPIDTSSMRLVDNGGTSLTASGARTTTIANGVSVTVSQPDGIYLVVAADASSQYGAVWLDFSRYALLLRQDDQRVVVAGEDLNSGATTPSFKITFYNLLNGVHAKVSGSFSGTAEFPALFPSGFDFAVATSGGQEIVVPVSAPETNAVIRVAANLSQQPQIFLTTDRPAYQKGEVVKFAGVVRMSNDQAYALKGGAKLALWTQLTDSNLALATVAADGTFTGTFTIPAAAFTTDGSDAWLTIYAGAATNDRFNPNQLTTSTQIVALAAHAPTSTLTVALDKPSYIAGEPVVASITGLNATGQPLAGATVGLSIYSTQHTVQPVEMDSFPGRTTWGDPVVENIKVLLDAAGHATYPVTAKVGLKAADREITVMVSYGTGKAKAVAARTAIFYQAADEVFLLPARTSYAQGDVVVAPFVVEGRSGARVANLAMAYELDRTDYEGDTAITTVVSSGTVSTNGDGMGTIRAPYTGSSASLTLRIKGKDTSGNVFEDAKDITVGWLINLLDVASDKIAYKVGDSAHLTVTSPAAFNVLLSLERGRVHQYKWLSLVKGANAVTMDITPDLAPGFTMVLSYVREGSYTSELFPVSVNNSARLLKLTVTPDQPSYTKGQTAHLAIAVADSADAPAQATLFADGYDARMSAYRLVDQASLAAAFLTPNPLGTNASSSLLGIGTFGGACGGGGNQQAADATYAGHTTVWVTSLATDQTGHATISVPITQSGAIRVVVLAGTATSAWGQAEMGLNVP